MHLFVQSDPILLSTSSRSIDAYECVALLLVILHGRLIDSTWRGGCECFEAENASVPKC